MRVLIVAAHPDDEVLGVGGALLRHVAAGDEVSVCIVTKAIEPLWSPEYMANKVREQARFDKLMGVSARFNLDFPTTHLNSVPHGVLNKGISEVVSQVDPRVVYTHSVSDLNQDHVAVFHGCMVATRPPRRIRLLCFETLSETEWGHHPFVPNYWVDISGQIEKKIEAFEIYASEVKEPPHPRSAQGIRSLARKRGSEVCADFAEAFAIIRDYC